MNTFKLPTDRFPLISALFECLKLKNKDLAIEIQENSICLGRIQRDKSKKNELLMTSCISKIDFKIINFFIFLIEQHDSSKNITKFSFKLTDKDKNPIKQYDLDTKRGAHIHQFKNYKKENTHIPFNNDLNEIAEDILDLILPKDEKFIV